MATYINTHTLDCITIKYYFSKKTKIIKIRIHKNNTTLQKFH